MPETTRLKGMTWNHSRGFDPMRATSDAYTQAHPHVTIEWDKRSLQAFADQPIETMTQEYDLIVIDHPHVGDIARNGLLLSFDGIGRDDELATLAEQSVGVSHASYQFDGHQWALAIDAATPVAAFRPDKLPQPPTRWNEVLELARRGHVAFALIPINALMTFFGMAKNKNYPLAEGEQLLARDAATDILETMREVTACLNPKCLELDPIGIYEWMSQDPDSPIYSPFGYGYTNYSRNNYRTFLLHFADAPGFDNNGPCGSVIGGTGIAISAACLHKDIAVDYAFHIASGECQKSLFFESGGQPANACAWEDDACNAATQNFFRNTRNTLETAWLRPRYNGYMDFQDKGGDIVHACLRGDINVTSAIDRLQIAYEESIS